MEEKKQLDKSQQKDQKKEDVKRFHKRINEFQKKKRKSDHKKMIESQKVVNGDVKDKEKFTEAKTQKKTTNAPIRQGRGTQNLGYDKNADREYKDLSKSKQAEEKSQEQKNLDELNNIRTKSDSQEKDIGLDK